MKLLIDQMPCSRSLLCVQRLFNGKAVNAITMRVPINILLMIYEMIQMYAEYLI